MSIISGYSKPNLPEDTPADMVEIFRLGLEKNQFPGILYKYSKLENLRYILEGGTIKFSRISEFNDTRECFAILDTDCTAQEWSQYLKKVCPTISEFHLIGLLQTIMDDPAYARQIVIDAIRETNAHLGILCLTPDPMNDLMWAHYADSHKGVCLEFDLQEDPNTFCVPKLVTYDDVLHRYNYVRSYLHNGGREAMDAIFHKTSDWSYEKEYRVVKVEGAGIRPFKIAALRTIIFGDATPSADIAEIKALCQTKGYTHIRFQQLYLDPSTGDYTLQPA